MLIEKDGSVHLAHNIVLDRTTNAGKYYKKKPPMFRGYINESGLGTLDSVKALEDESGNQFKVSLVFDDWLLNEVVLMPVLEDSTLDLKTAEQNRRAVSEKILKSLFGAPRKATKDWTEYSFESFSVTTCTSWNPIDAFSGGGINILYC